MEDRRPLFIALNVVFMVISIVGVVTRLLTRAFLIKSVGHDDILIAIALILALAFSSVDIVLTKYGVGLHMADANLNISAYGKHILIQGPLYALCHLFIKLSYLAFYLRLALTTRFRVILYISMGIVSAFGIATAIVGVAICIPIAKTWNLNMPGHCINVASYYISTSTLNMVFDIAIFLFPIPILWRLKQPRKQRLLLACIFSVGLIVLIASVLRVVSIISMLYNPAYLRDLTWYTVNSLIWSMVEIHLAVLISCTPAFKALVQKCFPGFFDSFAGNTNSHSQQQDYYTSHYEESYALYSCGHRSNIQTAISGNTHDADKKGSLEHIVGQGEVIRLDTTVSIHSSSKEAIGGGEDIERC